MKALLLVVLFVIGSNDALANDWSIYDKSFKDQSGGEKTVTVIGIPLFLVGHTAHLLLVNWFPQSSYAMDDRARARMKESKLRIEAGLAPVPQSVYDKEDLLAEIKRANDQAYQQQLMQQRQLKKIKWQNQQITDKQMFNHNPLDKFNH